MSLRLGKNSIRSVIQQKKRNAGYDKWWSAKCIKMLGFGTKDSFLTKVQMVFVDCVVGPHELGEVEMVRYQPLSRQHQEPITVPFSTWGAIMWMRFLWCRVMWFPLFLAVLWVVKLQIFVIFIPKIGEDEPILTSIFFIWGWWKTTKQFFFEWCGKLFHLMFFFQVACGGINGLLMMASASGRYCYTACYSWNMDPGVHWVDGISYWRWWGVPAGDVRIEGILPWHMSLSHCT